jgi:hypothetical protein
MVLNPGKWLRGRARWVAAPKSLDGRVHVRSSYEAAAVAVLEADQEVLSYAYEPRFVLPDGRWILPDFLVQTRTGMLLVEVKAAWVLGLPQDDKVILRLARAREFAAGKGWGFAIWTEKKELGDALRRAT